MFKRDGFQPIIINLATIVYSIIGYQYVFL